MKKVDICSNCGTFLDWYYNKPVRCPNCMSDEIVSEEVGMKIEIELPEWAVEKAKDHTIAILIAQELVAFKEPRKEWKVKKIRCVMCGECCHDTPDKHTPFGSTDDKCNACQQDADGRWPCNAGAIVPFRCLLDPNPDAYPNCAIRYF